jgi:hypothetical protein
MTAQQIYEMASSFLYERDGDDTDSKDFALGFLNVLLQEALETENSIRRFKGVEELTEAPYLAALSDTINYDGAITRGALPYGLASFYYVEAMDNFQSENYRGKFIAALNAANKATATTIEDQYYFPHEDIDGEDE